MGVIGCILEWFSFESSFSVVANKFRSSSLACGVPQGSISGPLKFLLCLLPIYLRTILVTADDI